MSIIPGTSQGFEPGLKSGSRIVLFYWLVYTGSRVSGIIVLQLLEEARNCLGLGGSDGIRYLRER